jgi:hypothetical protein
MSMISFFIPAPVNIYITTNTFVIYTGNNGSPEVGLIDSIDVTSNTVTLRKFLGWTQLLPLLGEHMIPNITFWPIQGRDVATYLCDTDIYSTVDIQAIHGLAFVFHYRDEIVEELNAMANVFVVSSVFNIKSYCVTHKTSFVSFPSQCPNSQLLSCFPSTTLRQILGIKEAVQRLMNSRSMSSKMYQSTLIHNIDPLSWHYILRVLQTNCTYHYVVVKNVYVARDEFVVKKNGRCKLVCFSPFLFTWRWPKNYLVQQSA